MMIAAAKVEIVIPYARSLKEKRQVVKSLIQRLKNHFNVSVAEVDLVDTWQRSAVGLACVSSTRSHARSQIDAAISFMEKDGRFEIVDVDIEDF